MTADSRRRWDTDDRLVGVADASSFAQSIEELAELARRPGWVAEEPEVHLVPHLRDANIAGLQVAGCQTGQDGVLAVSAIYTPDTSRHDLRQRAWALLGSIAEPAASVREHLDGEAVVFEVVTGIPDGPGPCASHGHSVRLTLTPTLTSEPQR
jgi:hypothetical protein